MMGIVDAPNAHLALPSFSRDRFPAAAEKGAVNRAALVATESHGLPPLRVGLFNLSREPDDRIGSHNRWE